MCTMCRVTPLDLSSTRFPSCRPSSQGTFGSFELPKSEPRRTLVWLKAFLRIATKLMREILQGQRYAVLKKIQLGLCYRLQANAMLVHAY